MFFNFSNLLDFFKLLKLKHIHHYFFLKFLTKNHGASYGPENMVIFIIFFPTVCHRHTSNLCMAGRGDSLDGVATCYNLISLIIGPVRNC
jgi:hypothetical protein